MKIIKKVSAMFITLAMILSIAVFTGRTVHAGSSVDITGAETIIEGLNLNCKFQVLMDISFNTKDFCSLNNALKGKYAEGNLDISFVLQQKFESGDIETRRFTKDGETYTFTPKKTDLNSSFCIIGTDNDSHTEYCTQYFEVVSGDIFENVWCDLSFGPIRGSEFDYASGPFTNALEQLYVGGGLAGGYDNDKNRYWFDLDNEGSIDVFMSDDGNYIFSRADSCTLEGPCTIPLSDETVNDYAKNEGAISKRITFILSHQMIETTVSKIKDVAYTGKAFTPKPTVQIEDNYGNLKTLEEGAHYTLEYKNNKNAGTASVIIKGKGYFLNSQTVTFEIKKAANPLSVKGKTAIVKYSKLRKKNQTLKVSKVIAVKKNGQGTITFTKKSGNKQITINKKTGTVTVKKGLKKGTYKVKVKVKAAGNKNYNAKTSTITFKVKVK